MLKITMDKNAENARIIEASGSLIEIINDFACAINDFYFGTKKRSPEMAELFRISMIGLVADPDSPVFKDKDEGGERVCIMQVTKKNKEDEDND